MNWYSGTLEIRRMRDGETSAAASWRKPDVTHNDISYDKAQVIASNESVVRPICAMYRPHPVQLEFVG